MMDPREARARAQAERAYRKAQRPFYKKKRFLLPVIFIGLLFLLAMCSALVSDGGEVTTTEQSGAGAADPGTGEPAPPAEPALDRFAGQSEDDIVGDPGQELTLGDVRVTATPLGPDNQDYFDGVCSTITMTNGGDDRYSFNVFEFGLQDPAGAIREPGIGGGNSLSSGELAPGGTVTGDACFEGGAEPGQYVLLYEQTLDFEDGRLAWVNQL